MSSKSAVTAPLEVDHAVSNLANGTAPNLNPVYIYRKKYTGKSPVLAGPYDRQGWYRMQNGTVIPVFRSRKNDEWITEQQFREEYELLRSKAVGKYFSSRKGFKIADKVPGTRAYLQSPLGRRYPVVFDESLTPRRLMRDERL